MAGNALKIAATWIEVENWEYVALFIDDAGDTLHIIADEFEGVTDSLYNDMYNAMHWIDVNWPSDGAIDMDAILSAIWNSDKLRWFHFINYIDSMRAGIWNTEIYDTHLAEWYRHFS